jgi:hypothetical protein
MKKLDGEADTFRRIEVITGTGRRRRWSEEVRAGIVAETLEEGARVSEADHPANGVLTHTEIASVENTL